MMKLSQKILIGIVILAVIALAMFAFLYGIFATTNQTTHANESTLFFPVAKNSSENSMLALLEGELVPEAGCLRVNNDYDNYLIVWPYGFSLSTEGGVIQVMDDTDQPIARVGDKLKVGGGGGEMVGEDIAKYSAQLPSDRCSGPYWIVGEVITSNKSNK